MKTLYFSLLIITGYLVSLALPAQADSTDSFPLYSITLSEIEEKVSAALVEKGAGDTIEASLMGQEKNTVYGSDKPISLDIRSLEFDTETKRWTANLLFSSDGAVLSAIPAGGRFQLMSKLPVLKKRAVSGSVITLEDIDWKTFPEHYSRKNIITDPEQLVGQTPRSSISEGRPIRDTEISRPAVVKKDALVKMQFQAANLHITVSGQAMTDGAQGEVINVKNVNSNQVIRAVVQNSNTVQVLPLVETSALGGALNAYN